MSGGRHQDTHEFLRLLASSEEGASVYVVARSLNAGHSSARLLLERAAQKSYGRAPEQGAGCPGPVCCANPRSANRRSKGGEL